VTYKSNMHVVLASVKKGWGVAVMEESQGLSTSSTIMRGNSSGGKSILGFALNEEREVVLMTVDTDHLDDLLQTTIEVGGINNIDGGICVSFPLDRMYKADEERERVPDAPAEAPATLLHEDDDEESRE
jgi:hypothetical protein